VRSVTLADNTADQAAEGGGAIRSTGGGSVSLGHSLIAQSIGVSNCAGPVVSLGYNLDDATSCGLSGTGDLSDEEARLMALSDYGGRTASHELLSGSPAVDAGDPAGCTDLEGAPLRKDQRGITRPADGDEDGTARCDIGAVERSADAPPPTPTPGTREGAIYLPWGSR